MRKFQCLAIATLAAALLLAPSGAARAGGETQPVSVSFAVTADGKEVGCGAPLANLGVDHREAGLHDARFYVHAVNLIDAEGARAPVSLTPNDWQYAGVALLDFKDYRGGSQPCSEARPAKNTMVTGTAPSGSYVGLEFSVGVPVDGRVEGESVQLNHSSTETSQPPLDVTVMAWNWQGGRKFLLVEIDPLAAIVKADGSKARIWPVHLGSSGCKGNPATGEIVSCSRENRFTVAFDRFDPKTQRVELDLTKLFEKTDLLAEKGGAMGCMSAPDDPECPAIFSALGLNLMESAPGAGDAGKQTRPGMSSIFKIGAAKPPKLAGSKP